MESNKENLNVDHESQTIIYLQRFLFCVLIVGESVFALFQFPSVFMFLERLLLSGGFFFHYFLFLFIYATLKGCLVFWSKSSNKT